MKKKIWIESSSYYLAILALHLCTFSWLWVIARQNPSLLGLGIVAYTLGLRHAFDADHIAAIDNTVRKLINQKQKSCGVGFYFSLGHSTVVLLIILLVNLSANFFKEHLSFLKLLGGKAGGIVSGTFLIFLAINNLMIFINLMTIRKKMDNQHIEEESFENTLNSRGFLAKILAPFLHMVTKEWHMYPIGFLFGLGFDTATEIGLISLSAENNQSVLGWNSMVFPLLFAAGMSLMDTSDSVMMSGAYRWAFSMPKRKMNYNLIVTSVSIIVAFLIGSVELVQVGIGSLKNMNNIGFWIANIDFNQVGIYMIIFFAALWSCSYFVWQVRKLKVR